MIGRMKPQHGHTALYEMDIETLYHVDHDSGHIPLFLREVAYMHRFSKTYGSKPQTLKRLWT